MLKHSLFAVLAATITTSAFAGAQCRAYPANERMDPAKFQAQLSAQGYQIKKFKVDNNCYEIYGKDKAGKKVEIYFDAKTGQAVKSKSKDSD